LIGTSKIGCNVVRDYTIDVEDQTGKPQQAGRTFGKHRKNNVVLTIQICGI